MGTYKFIIFLFDAVIILFEIVVVCVRLLYLLDRHCMAERENDERQPTEHCVTLNGIHSKKFVPFIEIYIDGNIRERKRIDQSIWRKFRIFFDISTKICAFKNKYTHTFDESYVSKISIYFQLEGEETLT